jgi:flagellar hook-associated protein 1 FlgK
MSLDLALQVARSGLAAVQRGLAQTAQNVANADTPGYTRKAAPQESMVAGGQPMGLRTTEARRDVDAALATQLDASRSAAAGAAAREELLAVVEAAHGTADGGGLADDLAGLHEGMIALRAAPGDTGAQFTALEDARAVAGGLNRLSDAIGTARQRAQDGIAQEVVAANAALREIAGLTLKIKAGGGGGAALEDQRDAAIARLSESIEVRAVRQPGGDLLLVARGGVVLPLDPDRDVLVAPGATVAPGASVVSGPLFGVSLNGTDITGQIGGGRLGEFIKLRDSTLPRFQAEADILAATVASRLDALGLRLFTDADGTVPDPAQPYAGGPQTGFAGRIRINPAVDADPSLLRDGTHAVAGAAGGPSAFTPNPPGGPAGFTALIDRVLDFGFGANAAPGVPWASIRTTGLGPDGTLASPFVAPPALEAYAARMSTAQTSDRASATAARTQAENLTKVLEGKFDQRSGVDPDAEMATMVALQNAYAANARVLGTVQAMWDSLLSAVR